MTGMSSKWTTPKPRQDLLEKANLMLEVALWLRRSVCTPGPMAS
jgi:hypothetical protein